MRWKELAALLSSASHLVQVIFPPTNFLPHHPPYCLIIRMFGHSKAIYRKRENVEIT